MAEAALLNNDPNQIFAFVRDHIALEVYAGSVRGARGTLWAGAGNLLDRASLLIALLGAAGFSAQYEHGLINSGGNPDASPLVRSMFPQTPSLIGCFQQVPGNFGQDPGTNGIYLNEVHDYYWVQYGTGGNNTISLDPNQPGAQPGHQFVTPDSNFTTVPQNLRQQVTVKLNVESYSQAGQLFGFGPGTSTVLTQQFDASALVGNILSVGNLVQATGGGALDVTATTFTYTPYLLIGSGGADITKDTVVTGTPFQELYTNFPLSSSIVTGIFLEIDADDAGYQQHPYTRTIFDRLGPAARLGNAPVSLSLPSTPTPAVTDYDITTVNILTSRQLLSAFQSQQTRLNNAIQAYQSIKTALAAVPSTGALTAEQQALVNQAITLDRNIVIAENEMITMGYDGAADAVAAQMDTGYYVRVYPNSPRLTIAASSFVQSTGNATFKLDVLKNDMRVVAGLYQTQLAPYDEEVARGLLESTMEATILSSVTGQTATDIGTIMGALGDPNLLTVLAPVPDFQTAPNPNVLAATTLSADAQALILQAVQNGLTVLTPNRMVTVNGITTVGWWETDQSGHMVSHFVDGGHQAIAEFGGVQVSATKYNQMVAKFIGFVEGIGVAGIAFAAGVLGGVANSTAYSNVIKAGKQAVAGQSGGNGGSDLVKFLQNINKVLKQLNLPEADPQGISLISSFSTGLKKGIEFAANVMKALLKIDPELFPFLSAAVPALPGVTPGSTAGVTVNIATDPDYTLPFNGNELPVFDATITNTGPTTDTFQLHLTNSTNFSVFPNVPAITLQAGQSGMVNVCFVPYDSFGVQVPTAGSTQNYSLTATGTTGAATATASPSFAAPALPTLSLTTNPQAVTVVPGGSTQVGLAFGATGNAAPGAVTVTATPDIGITVGGLTSPINIGLNAVSTQTITVNTASNLASGTYNVVFDATYTANGATQDYQVALPVTVAALGSCAIGAAAAANQIGKKSLGSTLANVANDMNLAAASPSNSLLVSRLTGEMNVLINSELDTPFLQTLTSSLTAANTAVSQAGPGSLGTALSALDTSLCSLKSTLNQANSFNGQITLAVNTQTAGPNQPATYTINLSNFSSSLRVYDLSVSGVPAGVTAQFNNTSVALGPFQSATYFSNTTVLTLTPGASFTQPFTFTVTATPEGNPAFAISAPGSLLVRPQAVSIDNVTVTPAFGPPGTKFQITARVFAEVNSDSTAYLQSQPYNSSGNPVTFGQQSAQFNLTTTSTLQTVTIGTFDSTNLPNGVYTLQIKAFNNGLPIPGATATGSVLVGAPLTGTLTANANTTPPGTVPPGSSTVQVALTLTRDSTPNPVSTLVGTVGLSGVPRSMVLYQAGGQQLAYVCSDAYVNIVDVSTPSNPVVKGTFAHDVLTTENSSTVPGFQVMACSIYNNELILSYSRFDGNTTAQPIPTHFATYSLANPLAPVQVGSVVDVQRSDSAGLYVAGNTALMYQSTTFYNPFSAFIFQETGDLWTLDLTNASTGSLSYLNDLYTCGGINPSTNQCNNAVNVPTASFSGGQCVSTGTTPIPNDATRGGPYRIGLGTAVNSHITYFASTSAFGADIEQPSCPVVDGQILVIDTSNPSTPSITTKVDVPAMTFMTGIAVQGNIAVAVGDSTGIYDINSGYVGTLVLASFDISNPAAPVLLNTVTTQLGDKGGAFLVPLGNNTFAVGGTTNGKQAVLVLVDAGNPNALRYIPYTADFVANPTIAQNGYFFALSATPISTTNSLSVFQLSTVNGPQLTARLQIPKGGNVAVVPASFNQTPSSVTAGTTFDTYEWDQPSGNVISFNESVTGVSPGDVVTVVNGGELDFTAPSFGAGVFPLPALTVLSQQILSINPETQNLNNSGLPATYAVTVTNPTNTSQTFTPSTLGIPSTWTVNLPANVTVSANASQTFNAVVTPALNTSPGTYHFFVTVGTAGGITASVGATLALFNGANTGGNPFPRAFSYTASVIPSTLTVGQGGLVTFRVAVTNTGNYTDTVQFSFPPNLPANWQFSFSTYSPFVQPGLDNTQYIVGTIQLPSFVTVTPGAYTITLPAQYFGIEQTNLSVTVNVVAPGVRGGINPGAGSITQSYSLVLTNIGPSTDTYNLSVIGPLAQAASLASTATIAAGQQATIPITLDPANYVTPGTVPLQIQVVSQANSAAKAVFSANITVPSTQSVTANITPSSATLSTVPGSVSLLVHANNTGNGSDTYSAAITNTNGPVTASLTGPGGSTQIVSPVFIPALGSSEIPLVANLSPGGSGAVTVTLTSLSNSTIKATTSVTIQNNAPAPPTASAVTGLTVPVHRLATLDASASSDPNHLALTFTWTLTSTPNGSTLTSASIGFAGNALAVFRPDKIGDYTFNVSVSNGTSSSQQAVTYHSSDFIPIAAPGNPFNVATGAIAFLDGSNSYDPDGEPITFQWTFASVPAGSALTSAAIDNAQTPRPFFTPDVAGIYTLQLTVSDASGTGNPVNVNVTAVAGAVPPNADAGTTQNAGLAQQVTLHGSGVDPNTSPLALTYAWTFSSVPNGSALQNSNIANPATATPHFTPDVAGDYVLSLVVSNAHGTSAAALTTVHAFSGNIPPNATAGTNLFTLPNTAVNLTAQGSSDPDSGPVNLAYLWWLNSLPPSSASTLSNPLTATPQFTPDRSGYYIPRVEAADGLASGFANVLITAAATCDADANGAINSTDIALIQAAIGQNVAANDPRDFNHDGVITSADVTGCTALIPVTATLQVLPTTLTFNVASGGALSQQPVGVSSTGSAITFTVSSDSSWLTTDVPGGSTASISTVEAIVHPAMLNTGTVHGNLTFTPASGSPITVMVTVNVSAPAGQPASITAAGGTPQSAQVSTAFATALSALVKDGSGNPLAGVTVSFQAPGAGASATLSNPTATTNATGIASVTATANAVAGGPYNVVASVGALTANFSLTNTNLTSVTIQTSPAGLSYSLDGVTYTATQTFSLAPGSSHPLSVPSPQAGTAGTQYVFAGWSDTGAVSHNISVSSTAITVTATFTTQYQLITTASPSGYGAVSPASGYFNAGSTVNLTATPAAGYTFVNWSGSVASPGSAATTIVMSGPESVIANFRGSIAAASITPQNLNLEYAQNTDPSTAAGTLAVVYAGSGGFTVTSPVSWLIISTSGHLSGDSATIVTVTPMPAGLAPGLYFADLKFTFGDGSTADAIVSLHVYQIQFRVAPASMTFLAAVGSSAAMTQTLGVGANGKNFPFQIAASTSAGGNWLSVSKASATTPIDLTITANPSGLAPGTYNGTLTLSASVATNSPFTVPVTLTIPTPPPTISISKTVNAASNGSGAMAPNTILTAYGSFPGCSNNAQVLVNGSAASVFFSNATQINFLLPASVSTGPSAGIQISCAGLAAPAYTVPITTASPGIFTVSQNGTGAADVVNLDGSIDTPAPENSYVQLYVTGAGLLGAPAFQGLSLLLLPVTATVGGVPATVEYAGEAPGYTPGLQQINVLIPSGLTHGVAAPLVLTIGGVATQTGVTIAIQ